MRFKALFVLLFWSVLAFAQQAGKVDFVEGVASVLDRAGKTRPAKLGEVVAEGDTLVTGSDGELHVAMEDGGQIALHPDSRLLIVSYRADGGKSDISVLNLVQGALRSVTGWIGKYNPKRYQIRTATATIGIRGTDHETRVIAPGSTEGEPGTYDRVFAGGTRLSTAQGAVDVKADQAGFVASDVRQRPRLLAGIPAFFRPLRQEGRFQGLHERIRQRIGQIREARIRHLMELRRHNIRRPAADGQRAAERLEARPAHDSASLEQGRAPVVEQRRERLQELRERRWRRSQE